MEDGVGRTDTDHGKISARIQILQDELKEISDIRKQRILYEMKAILESKITDYVDLKTVTDERTIEGVDKDGEPVELISKTTQTLLSFKDFSEFSEQQIRAIESIKHGKYGIELKLHGKSWTTERIVKMLGYEAPRKLDVKSGDKELSGFVMVLPSNGREVKLESE